jgi:hypothetical protein
MAAGAEAPVVHCEVGRSVWEHSEPSDSDETRDEGLLDLARELQVL